MCPDLLISALYKLVICLLNHFTYLLPYLFTLLLIYFLADILLPE